MKIRLRIEISLYNINHICNKLIKYYLYYVLLKKIVLNK